MPTTIAVACQSPSARSSFGSVARSDDSLAACGDMFINEDSGFALLRPASVARSGEGRVVPEFPRHDTGL